jgi:hypothetical protein
MAPIRQLASVRRHAALRGGARGVKLRSSNGVERVCLFGTQTFQSVR